MGSRTPILVQAAAVQAAGEHGEDLDQVLGEWLLPRHASLCVKQLHFNAAGGADREDQFGAKPQQAILGDQHQTGDLAAQDSGQQPAQARFGVDHARAQVSNLLVHPAVGVSVLAQALGLRDQILALIRRAHPGVGDRGAEHSVQTGMWQKPVFLRQGGDAGDTRKVVFSVFVFDLKATGIKVIEG